MKDIWEGVGMFFTAMWHAPWWVILLIIFAIFIMILKERSDR